MLFSGSIKLGFDKFLTILILSSNAHANLGGLLGHVKNVHPLVSLASEANHVVYL